MHCAQLEALRVFYSTLLRGELGMMYLSSSTLLPLSKSRVIAMYFVVISNSPTHTRYIDPLEG